MKKVLLLLAVLLMPMFADAQQVSEQEALQKAQQFFANRNKSQAARGMLPRKAPKLTLANDRDEYYVFNDEANGGYVVVSGEERMPDVLAYSYEGNYDVDSIPSNMQAWMEEYAGQVEYLRAHPAAKVTRRTVAKRRNISPLLTCTFDQRPPYNNKCPLVNGKHCVTGCSATAMAQIMYYHKWPKQTTDVIPAYTTRKLKIDVPAIPITTIDWDNMLHSYLGYYAGGNYFSEKQIDAISTLMLLCGASIKMDYSTDGSAGGGPVKALHSYFGYDDTLAEVYRDGCDTDVWDQLIYEELAGGRPVFYSGYEDTGKELSYGAGHAFVLDGYEDGYFHINWGWGYMTTNALMTGTEGWAGYTQHQEAIIGIRPATDDIPKRYAVFDNGKMTLYYDKEKAHRSGTILKKDDWGNYKEEITECVIDPSFANLKLTSLYEFFSGWSNMKSIEGLEHLNTSMVKTMNSMFSGCSSLTSLDLSCFDTDNVVNMSNMFSGCTSLTSIDVSSFNTDNVTSMNSMFKDCKSLMFIIAGEGWSTFSVTSGHLMFQNCYELVGGKGTQFDKDHYDYTYARIDGGRESPGYFTEDGTPLPTSRPYAVLSEDSTVLTFYYDDQRIERNGMKIDSTPWRNHSSIISTVVFDVSMAKCTTITSTAYWFSGLVNLTSIIGLENLKTDNVTNMMYMFYGCSGLTSIDVSRFKTDNVTNMSNMFDNCSGLRSLDLSSFCTDNVKNLSSMFCQCESLSTIYVSERWNMANVDYAGTMFYWSRNIVGGEGTAYNDNHTDGDYARIDGGPDNPGYFTYKAPQYYAIIYTVDGEIIHTDYVKTDSVVAAMAAPTKKGYTFSGWSKIPATMPAEDVTVTGSFTINRYKLTYIVDGEEYKSSEVEFGTALTAEAELSKEGYTFSGWSKIPKTMPAKDVTISGTFTVDKYKLIYIVDGKGYKTYEIEYGAVITPEAEPTKEGYMFNGWSEIPDTMPAMDVTVTGTFRIKGYKLIFLVDGKEYKIYSMLYGMTLIHESEAFVPKPEPKKEGYTFSGWSEIPETMPAEDVTVSGSFTVNKYKLTYSVDGKEYKSSEVEYGTALTAEAAPEKEGYTFSGWSEIPETMPAKDVTVSGSFTVNKYKLTYSVDGKDYKASDVEFGTALTAEAAPEKEGYTFSGWSEIPETMPAKDVTVTGSFTVNKYKLTYTVDGKEYKASEVEFGTALTAEAAPEKEGYTFSGWNEIPETMPAKDVTVTGSFTVNKYKLTYTVDGKEYKSSEVEFGTALTAKAAPEKEGYTFSGWSEIPETMPAKDVTVTGTFTINKYKLMYTVDGEEYKSSEVEYGTVLTAEAAPTKVGYTFSGWSEIPETMPANDVTATGSFTINSYKLTYKVDDKVYKEAVYEYGATITPELQPEGDYLTFEWVDLPKTMPAKDVVVLASYTTGIVEALMATQHNVRIFAPNGKKLNKPQKGLNIVILDDGTVKKMMVK